MDNDIIVPMSKRVAFMSQDRFEDILNDGYKLTVNDISDLLGMADSYKKIKIAIKHGMDVNTILDAPNNHLLHICAICANVKLCRLLLKHDADINVVNNRGRTPLKLSKSQLKWSIQHKCTCRPDYVCLKHMFIKAHTEINIMLQNQKRKKSTLFMLMLHQIDQ